jgi:hypothetical protein
MGHFVSSAAARAWGGALSSVLRCYLAILMYMNRQTMTYPAAATMNKAPIGGLVLIRRTVLRPKARLWC